MIDQYGGERNEDEGENERESEGDGEKGMERRRGMKIGSK